MSSPTAPGDQFIARDVYAAYPHCNAFFDDGRRMVVGDATAPRLLVVDVEPDASPELVLDLRPLGDGDGRLLWFDVAVNAPILATTWSDSVITLELADASAAPSIVYTAGADARIDGLVSINAEGTKVAAIEVRDADRSLLVIDLATGRVDRRLHVAWTANHVQFSPADDEWIGFAHEGASTEVDDRVWGSHPVLAPFGRPLADQAALSSEDRPLALGHERWMFHRADAIVVAYGDGPSPRGVWEVPTDDRAPRLLSAGERDWHCGISRDGTRIVVDTTGPADAPGSGWTDAGDRSTLVVIDVADGSRRALTETRFLPHPFHPHPAFTPDGTRIVFNRVDDDGTRGVAVVDALLL
ncbi:hypothetical protein QFZ53_000729 [Microbacterium natoriense]|uniref:Oligogalacturonate lyase domain-containing protein n=1 Tax=Microbacterium natoriense TaxID=284570 RepID=A0AAW8ETD4_9MICO|nr:oligogalacturonate lyase family protein [Microbacterium natoriense]MDQ0646533.1 hypothetical protein [Microbacterium natoriense]